LNFIERPLGARTSTRQTNQRVDIGRKIGFTNRNIWAEYGATAPILAHVYDSALIYAKNNKASDSLCGSVAPRLEPEHTDKHG
jgi:2-keto-4-pentenoate hydratase